MGKIENVSVVIVDRIRPGETPPYCIHGESFCVTCDQAVWLGHATVQVVRDDGVLPLCKECAVRQTEALKAATHMGNVRDHLRADGPHE